MKTIRFIPGNIVSPNPITIPTGAPSIDAVVSAEITRLVDTLTLGHNASAAAIAHADGVVVPHTGFAVDPHAAHTHDIATFGAAGAPAVLWGWDAPPAWSEIEDSGAAALHTFVADNTTGILDAVIAAHVVTQPDDHTPEEIIAGLANHAGVDVAGTLINHAAAGVTPVVAATPTRLTARTISLNVNTNLGDLLVLSYQEVGERVLVA